MINDIEYQLIGLTAPFYAFASLHLQYIYVVLAP